MCWWTAGSLGWWWLAPVFMVIVLGLIAWVAIALVRTVDRSSSSGRDS